MAYTPASDLMLFEVQEWCWVYWTSVLQQTAFVVGIGAVFEAGSTRVDEGQLDFGAMILVY